MRSSSAAIRSLTLLLFLVLVSVIAYWAMQLLVPRGAIAPPDSLGDNSRPPLHVAGRLFGARNTAAVVEAPPPINVKVLGILEAGRRGVAILSIDDRPARAYAVNQRTEGGSIVRSVQQDKVTIDHHGQNIEARPPRLWSIDILSSNAGRSGLPAGIEAADDATDDFDAHDSIPAQKSAGAPPAPGMTGAPPMQPPPPGMMPDNTPAMPSPADFTVSEREAAMQALERSMGETQPIPDDLLMKDPAGSMPPPPPDAPNRHGMAFPRMYDSVGNSGTMGAPSGMDGQ